MADPVDQTTPPSSDSLSNPQSMVDAALQTEPTTTTPAPVAEPVAPVTPVTPLPTLMPLTVAPVPDVAPNPAPVVGSVPMGDDTPLAFAMPAPSSSPAANPVVATPPIGATEQASSYIPPVSPAPTMAPEEPKKKKSKVGLIIGGVMALLLFVVGGGGGYYYFTTGQIPSINKAESEKVNQHKDGYAGVIQNNQLAANAQYNANNNPAAAATVTNSTTAAPTAGQYGWCYSGCSACPGGACASTPTDWKPGSTANIAGTYTTTNVTGSGPATVRVQYSNADTSNAAILYNAANGGIVSQSVIDPSHLKSDGTYDTINLPTPEEMAAHPGQTWVPGGVGCNGMPDRIGTTANPGPCMSWHWTTCANAGTGVNGVGCDVKSNTQTTTTTTTTTTTDTTPTMSCTGISSVPDVASASATPKIGNKVTFTCAGAVVPASAGTLSYKFRYSINSGTAVPMTNVTATTAALTIAACGEYSVECQACATLGGVLTCDPIWTGATTQ